MENKNNLARFIDRLNKIGINVMLGGNYPWIYIDIINGKRVIETFEANHGFTVAFLKQKANENDDVNFTDISEIFKLIRKYIN